MRWSPVVVVTGASAGLGRAFAHGFTKRGAAKIGLIARNPEALNAAKSECQALGGSTILLPVDVSDAEAVDKAASRVEQEFGQIDIRVNEVGTIGFEVSLGSRHKVTKAMHCVRPGQLEHWQT